MKKSNLICVISLFLLSSSLSAQSVFDSLRYKHSVLSMKKKSLVLNYMNLTEAEKSSFWPVYENYTRATQYFEVECIYLIFNYTRSLNEPISESREDLSNKLSKINKQLSKIREHYFKKFKKALSEEQAIAFMELDEAFHTQVLTEIPRNAYAMETLSVSLNP